MLMERRHTHSDNDTEQPTDYPVHNSVKFGIAGRRAIQSPVGVFLLHAQAEQIWLRDNKIEILVVQL